MVLFFFSISGGGTNQTGGFPVHRSPERMHGDPGDSADGAGRRCMPCHAMGRKIPERRLGTRDVRLALSRSCAIGPSESCNFALPVRVFREMTSCTKREKPASPPRSQISERCPYHLAQNGQMGWGQGESADVSKRRGARSLLCCAMSTVAQADAAKRAPGPLAAAEGCDDFAFVLPQLFLLSSGRELSLNYVVDGAAERFLGPCKP